MNAKYKIIGVGNPIVDAIAKIEDAFLKNVSGEKGGMELADAQTIDKLLKLIPTPPTIVPGGSAGNVIFSLAQMGAHTTFLGKVGSCSEGKLYQDRFKALGGDTSRFKVSSLPNGQCLSLVTPDGERTMRTNLGAAMTLTPEDISISDFSECSHAHIEGYLLFNEALMMRVLECAKESGCTISLDLASFEVVNATLEILPKILSNYVDIVFANEEEAQRFTGKTNNEYIEMAQELATHCKVAAVKVGAHGSYIATESAVTHIAPVSIDNLIDTTAAGDLWAAGFLYGWSKKQSAIICAQMGSILGAAAVQVHGSVLSEQKWSSVFKEIKSLVQLG